MTHRLASKTLTLAVVAACSSLATGCFWGHREPRHDDRVVVEEHHDAPHPVERHDDHHDDR